MVIKTLNTAKTCVTKLIRAKRIQEAFNAESAVRLAVKKPMVESMEATKASSTKK